MCLKNTLLTPNKVCACVNGFICVRLPTHTRAKNLSFMMSCMRCTRSMRSKAGFRRAECFGKSGRRDDQFIFAVGKNSNVACIRFYYWFLKTLNTCRSSNADFSVVVSLARAQLERTQLCAFVVNFTSMFTKLIRLDNSRKQNTAKTQFEYTLCSCKEMHIHECRNTHRDLPVCCLRP
jgi:hypothetical protein